MKIERSCNIISKTITGDAVSMTIETGDMVGSSFRNPGQFVHIKCGDALLLRRPISVCCWTETTVTIVFEVRGEGTDWLAQRSLGEKLDVLGLAGNGFPIKQEGRYLLVGGGIGVPPMLGCAQYTKGGSTAILGFRSKEKALLLNEFEAQCEKVMIATDDGSMGYHGFVDALVHQELAQDNRYDAVLACGPKPMLRSVAKVAAESNIPCLVSMEERMGCGVGACLVCACDMADGTKKHVCKDGPVFDAQEVDWNV